MKIVFLDFDGVLNSSARAPEEGDAPVYGNAAEELWGAGQIEPAAVARLNDLLARSGAHVVVSSTWRKLYALEELRGLLTARGFAFPERIHDVTPVLWRDERGHRLVRGDEIQAWLDAHPEVTAFVILDDDDDMAHLAPRLVQTLAETGLLDAHVEVALLHLGTKR